ncbi:MAG: 16S rRNA (cytosine(967)-C(5))-methyltransferase RsmB [Gammaproteobacteria bacterium]|nr:16S rRNA (cytosine(967)-C(5))-methyltransferase RsmB [Gammaproteobacteria bacterium]
MNARATAAHVLNQVCGQGRSLSQTLASLPAAAQAQRPLIAEMCYGTLRDYPRLSLLLGALLKKPLKPKDGDVRALMLLGLYQLTAMRVPEHAAVSETVAAVTGLKKTWARGLVNAVLRNFQRRSEALLAQAAADEPAHWGHPQWLLDSLQTAWPDHWQAIAHANNQRPPMTLRVNRSMVDTPQYLRELDEAGIAANPGQCASSAVYLSEPVDVTTLPGFEQGRVSVQDEAPQLAAELLDVHDGHRVLDVCAAPGGKTGHLLELAKLDLVAVDVDGERLQRVRKNLQRLRQSAQLMVGDASDPTVWWDGRLFDRILLDAPCSATGVIRRHPDIKLLRRASDIPVLVALQAEILDAVWPLLKPGGMLLYATCSVLPQENAQQVAAFLTRQPDAEDIPLKASGQAAQWGRDVTVGRQVFPGDGADQHDTGGMDGFYYACVEKKH